MFQTALSRFAVFYLVERLVFRISEFFRRWYIAAGKEIIHITMRRLSSLDRKFALKITFLHFFMPLYGDETFIGRILGIVFRSLRIIIALALYLVIILFALVTYFLWALVPVFLLAKIIGL